MLRAGREVEDGIVLFLRSQTQARYQPAAAALPIIQDALERYSRRRRKGFMPKK